MAATAGDPASFRIMLVLLGIVGTLITGVVLQVIIVPYVQARIRRRERWEDVVNELDNLLQDQLKRSVEKFRHAASSERILTQLLDAGGMPEWRTHRAEEELVKRTDERRAAQDVVDEHLDRVGLLATRVRQIQPRSRVWAELDLHALMLRFHLPNFLWAASGLIDPHDQVALDKLWDEQEQAREAMVAFLKPIIQVQHPPRQHPLDRWPVLRRLLNPWPGRRLWSSGRPASAPASPTRIADAIGPRREPPLQAAEVDARPRRSSPSG